MKRFFTLTLATLAAIAFSAVYLLGTHVLDPVVSAWRHVKIKVKEFAVHAVSVLAEPVQTARLPAVHLIQAKAFFARMAQRSRPQITSSWRMCTST